MKTRCLVLILLSALLGLHASERLRIGEFKGVEAKPQVEIKTFDGSFEELSAKASGVIYYAYSPSYRMNYYSDKMEKGKFYQMVEMNSRAFFLTIDRPWRLTLAGWDQLPSAKMSASSGGPVLPKKKKSVKPLPPVHRPSYPVPKKQQ